MGAVVTDGTDVWGTSSEYAGHLCVVPRGGPFPHTRR